MQKELRQFCADSLPGYKDIRVSEPESVSEGWESDVYAFDIEHGSHGRRATNEMILRIYPGNDAFEKSHREFEGMRKLHLSGYPVPEVFLLCREHSPLGRPFMIMERIRGRGMWDVLSESQDKKQMDLLTEFCSLEAGLHELDWRILEDDLGQYDDPFRIIDDYIDRGRHLLDSGEIPGFQQTLEWLEERRTMVPCPKPSPVHLDLHPANVIIRDDGRNYVIDWTQVSVSDPRLDLSWTMLLMSTHMEKKWRNLVLREYQLQSVRQIVSIEYFEVLSCVKRLISVYMSLNTSPESLGMRPEAAEMMKGQMSAIRKVYFTLLELTGLEIPEIEKMLEQYLS